MGPVISWGRVCSAACHHPGQDVDVASECPVATTINHRQGRQITTALTRTDAVIGSRTAWERNPRHSLGLCYPSSDVDA